MFVLNKSGRFLCVNCNRNINFIKICYVFTVIPVLQLDLGSKMNPNDIDEGDDVYFECKIHSNPPAYKVIWKHNVSKLICKVGV